MLSIINKMKNTTQDSFLLINKIKSCRFIKCVLNLETMTRIKKTYFLFLTLLAIFLTACSGVQLSNLQVEYTETPLGIDVEKPRFSWQMRTPKKMQSQTAYQIIVTDEKQEVVWNSGKVASDISLNIYYEGKPLKAETQYIWHVKVWDQDKKTLTNQSWFETGLMNPSMEAWDGAKWIGGADEDLVLYPDYLPTYTINYTLQLDRNSGSTKAGFIYGANDPRLMDKNRNIYNLQNGIDESYVQVELDISPLLLGKNALLHIYRVGYAPTDSKEKPLTTIEIPQSIIHTRNMYEKHTFCLKTMYSKTAFFMIHEGQPKPLGSAVINPLGDGWDYICFPLLCEIGFAIAPNQSASFSDLEVRNYREPGSILFAETLNQPEYTGVFSKHLCSSSLLKVKENAYQINGGETGAILTTSIEKKSMPMLRTTFSPQKATITKARLYITARGIYEAYLNGKKVGDDYFNPGLTQYNKHHLYQTYDVTEHIRSGENALGIMLGEGWWSGAITYMGYLWNLFGDRQAVLSKLVISYADGTKESIVSQPETWSCFDKGPLVYSSFFQGEVYDAQKEELTNKWSEAGFDASGWQKATAHAEESLIKQDPHIENNRMPAVNDFSSMHLIGQFGKTVQKVKELTAVSMEEPRPGVYMYDMGQNMVGVPKISLTNQVAGDTIKLRFAEVIYPDLPEFKENVGMIMLENIRGAMAQDIYITKGGNEVIHPRFTFHGYRYIEITGISKALPLEAVKGDVLSSIHALASSYETSNQKVNKLWENITWSTRGNFLSIPTDCPQRNERMGWSGDISVFSRTATYMANVPQFLRRHMLAMRDTQREDGRFADVAPIGGGFGGILWGSAGITVPWESFMQYNDREMLSEHYEAMKAYINYLKQYIDPTTGILTEGNLGDWLGPEQEKNDNSLLWEAYFIYDLELMSRIATLVGKDNDASHFKQLKDERKEFFNRTYFDSKTGQTIHSGFNQPEKKGKIVGTVTSYVIPLAFDICTPELKELVIKNLLNSVQNESKISDSTSYPPYSLMTGFIGTAWINRLLSDLGHTDIAYKVLQQTSYPSWLYSVEQGATTIWERLNSYTPENGFGGNNSMNSFNHYSFGSIGSWMYNYSLGIERDENAPGFKHFILRPQPDFEGEMSAAKGHYDSMYGRIESSWELKQEGNQSYCDYHFSIPGNTTATLYIQAEGVEKITESGTSIHKAKGVELQEEKKGIVLLKLYSGKYHFRTVL